MEVKARMRARLKKAGKRYKVRIKEGKGKGGGKERRRNERSGGDGEKESGKKRWLVEKEHGERITCAVKESKKDGRHGAVMRQGSAPRSVIIATGRGN